jgi:trafficking protein particle complex subunit 2
MWINDSCFLRVVDKFDSTIVSAYVSFGGYYLLLIHDGRDEDQIRYFFQEVHDILSRYILNPFIDIDSPISSKEFDARVASVGRMIT